MGKKNYAFEVYAETQRLALLASTAIERVMTNAGLTRAQLARKLKLPKSRVTKVLDGEANVTLKTLAQFGLACGVRWDFVGTKADDSTMIVDAPKALFAAEDFGEMRARTEALAALFGWRKNGKHIDEPAPEAWHDPKPAQRAVDVLLRAGMVERITDPAHAAGGFYRWKKKGKAS